MSESRPLCGSPVVSNGTVGYADCAEALRLTANEFQMRVEKMEEVTGRFLFVLHSHIPYVMNHGAWPHGEHWLFEAGQKHIFHF